MVEAEQRFTDGRFETPKQSWEKAEFEHTERRPSQTARERLKEARRIREVLSELQHFPVIAVILPEAKPAGKPESPKFEKLTIWDIILMLLAMLLGAGQALLTGQAEKSG